MARRKKNRKSPSFVMTVLISVVICLFIYAVNSDFDALKGINPALDKTIETISNLLDDSQKKNTQIDQGSSCEITVIDVGQGDSTLIETPKGEFILVDTGPSVAKYNLSIFLEESEVEEIEYLILTHPHTDHIGNATQVLEDYKINNIIMPNVSTTSATFTKLLDAIKKEKKGGCKVYSPNFNDEYTVDDCKMTILGPVSIDAEDLNNCSVVMSFEYGDFRMLFTGDAEIKEETEILKQGADVRCNVLKSGHHGSSTSGGEKLLDSAMPEVALISCEKDNSYGHPHAETLRSYEERVIEYYITYETGNITVNTDGKSYDIVCEKENKYPPA